MTFYKDVKLLVLLAVFCQVTNLSDGWLFSCRTVTTVACHVGSRYYGGWAGGLIGRRVCSPISRRLCDKRRRTIVDPLESDKLDNETQIIQFPQSFDDYNPKDGKISLDLFIEAVEDVLPAHLHGLLKLMETFSEADKNGDDLLDKEEFLKGSWIVDAEDIAELKRSIMANGMDDELRQPTERRKYA